MKRRAILTGGLALTAIMSGGDIAHASRGEFHVPAEEDPHEFTFMQWPASRKVHPDPDFLSLLQITISELANAIAEFEPVVLLAASGDHAAAQRQVSSQVELWDIPTEDLWCRDSGPIVVRAKDGRRAVRHIEFNGWGGRQIHKRDGVIAERAAERLGMPLLSTGLRGEAGGVEQDGHGLLIAHESSWVHENRNPGLNRQEIETRLLDAYGADRMLWTPGVRNEDITDYHIDSLARFTGPGRILLNLPDEPDRTDPFHAAAIETHDALVAAVLDVDVIPEPNHRRVRSYDFVASYANYYVCNGAVIAAQFGDTETDALAANALKRHFPSREIVLLNVDALGEVGGGIHCATHEVPAA